MKGHPFTLVLVLSLTASADQISNTSGAGAQGALAAAANGNLPLKVGSREFDIATALQYKTFDTVFNATCAAGRARQPTSVRSLCHQQNREGAKKSIQAAAKTLGFPSQPLACLISIESRMFAGQTSRAGAKGLTQFMPTTARRYESMMKKKPEYRAYFQKYKQEGGAPENARFTKSTIISSNVAHAGTQIFASALYWRHELDQAKSKFERDLGSPQNINKEGAKNLFRYLMIAYNAGGGRAKSFARQVAGGANAANYQALRLPKETKGYLENFDKCMEAGEPRANQASRQASRARGAR